MGLAPLDEPLFFDDVSDMPEPLGPRLAVLLTTPVWYYDPVIGRHTSEDVFWVYTGAGDGEAEYWEETCDDELEGDTE